MIWWFGFVLALPSCSEISETPEAFLSHMQLDQSKSLIPFP